MKRHASIALTALLSLALGALACGGQTTTANAEDPNQVRPTPPAPNPPEPPQPNPAPKPGPTNTGDPGPDKAPPLTK